MRRGVVLLVAISLVFTLGVPALADRPTEEVSDFVTFQCQLSGEGGEGFVFVEIHDDFVFADAAIWLPGSIPFETEPDLFSAFEEVEASAIGGQVTATIPLIFSEDGAPDGTLTLTGTIGVQVGQETFEERFRDGNRWVEIEDTITFFEATASVDLDGSLFESTCSAEHVHSVFYSTNPRAFRISFDDASIECFAVEGSDGSTLFLFAGEFDGEGFLDLQIFAPDANPEEEVPDLFGFAEIGSLFAAADVTVPLFAPFDGDDPVDEALVDLTVTEGAIIDSDIVFQNGKIKETTTELVTSGTVELASDGRTFDLGECSGSQFDVRGIITSPAGPQAKGKAPANDLPSGATALGLGDRVNQQTKSTAFEPEGSCLVDLGDEDPFEIMGKTVWYVIDGTGGAVTVDTVGSDFDTVISVYEADGDLTEPLDCVDDTAEESFSLQAKLTWETEPGVAYLIQVGGFAGEYGLVKLSTSG